MVARWANAGRGRRPSNTDSSIDLFLIDAETWTFAPLGLKDCADPAYSPDGGRIAYERFAEGLIGLHVVSLPGGTETHLTGADSINPSHPAWSPDGNRLVVESYIDGSHPKLYLVDSATGAATQLTAKDGYAPAWLP